MQRNTRPGSSAGQNMNAIERALYFVGGAYLALRALRPRAGLMRRLALLGAAGGLLYRGTTANTPLMRALNIRPTRQGRAPLFVTRSVTVRQPPDVVYGFWRHFENLPRFMQHLESVEALDDRRSRWRARSPFGGVVEWEAEVTHEVPNRELGWRSLPGADVDNAGRVRFNPGADGESTQLEVELTYSPPAGKLGAVVARLFGEEPQLQVDEDLQRFRELMEAGGRAGTAGELAGGADRIPPTTGVH